eukprot:CAMPEP_0197827770 /NCGR_PEP_ID=MMETSP1437-20131217/4485_1 /TAXON_ID=49252 ORGANISM="Eucampia antarctica, Strain CCMP1452" /NCGR_SAMPLE_ID=MMETSP1437 /ASSEMBLY_ACC=CAM_ASM_001096 /LENGTH=710 /DNA_ID=CAMNT_0043428753 /DNA_START=263 /DNA_END=2395 /DNA_ORIENTATION=+
MLPKNAIQLFLSCIITFTSVIGVRGNVDDEDDEKSFTTQVTFIEMYSVIIFIITVYYIGHIGTLIGLPPLVGHVFAGIFLGPPLLNFVPYVKALVLTGEIGLTLQMFEAGIEVDVALLRNSGTRAILMSITSAMLATGTGISVGILFGLDFQGAYAIGATFAQTGNAVCLPVLRNAGLMSTHVGQMILAATVIDDMIALTLLSVLLSFVSDQSPSVIDYFIPCISSIGSLMILGVFAIFLAPLIIDNHILPKIPNKLKKFVLFLMMVVVAAAYLPLLRYIKASYLIGAFLSGATFSQVKSAHNMFLANGTDVITWLNMLFFACTIGFQVPIKLFFGNRKVWILGSSLIFTAVAIKFVSAVFVPKLQDVEKGSIYNHHRRNQLVTGVAMTCRGGFGLLIAASALSKGIIDAETYASIILAILFGILVPPFILNFVIERYNKLRLKKLDQDSENSQNSKSDGKMNLFVHLHVETRGEWGLVEKLTKKMSSADLVVERVEISNSRTVNTNRINDLYIRDNATTISQSKETNIGNERETFLTRSNMVKEEKMVEKRIQDILNLALKEMKQFGATEVEITQYNPYNANDTLDALVLPRRNGQEPSLEFFSNMFEIFDKDGDGHIDIDVLRSGMIDANFDISDEGIDVLLKSMDKDCNNIISFEEWNTVIEKKIVLKKKERRFSYIGTMDKNIRSSTLMHIQQLSENDLEDLMEDY